MIKIRPFITATMLASLLSLVPHAYADTSSACDHKEGDFFDRLVSKADCLNENVDKKVEHVRHGDKKQPPNAQKARDKVKEPSDPAKQKHQNKHDNE